MFSFVNGVLLRPLPYPESDRIVRVLERHPTGSVNGISTLNYLDWNQNAVFDAMAAEVSWRPTLATAAEPVWLQGARVSAQYFDIFGARPALGRVFLRSDDLPGNGRVVLLSHALWEQRFSSDPGVVGRNLQLDGESYLVIGVLTEGPFDRVRAQIWTPLVFEPSNMTRDFRWLSATARLRPGVPLTRARAEMNVMAQRLATAYPDSNKGWGIALDPLADVLIPSGLHTAVTVLFAATLFVLLIGCANLANLALARSLSRQGEMAVRSALGATRGQLAVQLVIENIVLSLCGGIAGLGAGAVTLKWIQSLIPASALPPTVTIGMDMFVVVFTFAVAVISGVLFGLSPAVHATRPGLDRVIRRTEHGIASGNAGQRFRHTLVVIQVALAFVLLVSSGLLLRSFFALARTDPGFTAANVLTAGLPISQQQHSDPIELNAYLASIIDAVTAMPGVREAAITSSLPLQGWGYGVRYSIADRESTNGADPRPVFFKIVSPSYFDTLGIKLLAGRGLSDRDVAGAPRVTLINEALARREFPDGNPIGRRILVPEIVAGTTTMGRAVTWEIVGVIANEKTNGLGDDASAGLYVSNQQSPTYGLSLVVGTRVPPRSLERAVRSAIARVNRNQALSDVRPLEEIVEQSMLGNRVVGTLIAGFGSIALLLAALGLFGVVSYTAIRRQRELGIRAALGASTGSLRQLIFLSGMRPTLIGLAIGFIGVFDATLVLSSMLYGVGTSDPLTLAAAAVALGGIAALSSFVPAWRMTRTDPMEALRYH